MILDSGKKGDGGVSGCSQGAGLICLLTSSVIPGLFIHKVQRLLGTQG